MAVDEITTNSTILPYIDYNAWTADRIVEVTVNFLLALATVIGNAIIIVAVYQYDKFSKESSLLIINLAVADFLVGLTSAMTTTMLAVDVLYIALNRNVCMTVNICMLVSVGASFICMPVITFDRYVAIIHPYRYTKIVNDKTIYVMLAIPWMYSLSWIPLLFHFDRYTPQTFCQFELALQEDFARSPVVLFFANALILITMNAAIFVTAWKKRRAINDQKSNQANYHGALKLAKTYAWIVGVYILCYVWRNLITVFEWSGYQGDLEVMGVLKRISFSLVFANSAANIFIYTTRISDFRAHTKQLLLRPCRNMQL